MTEKLYPHLAGKRIQIFTRSASLEMYRTAKTLFETAGLPCVRLVDQHADGYFFTILKDKNCDIAINIDEDAFVTDLDAILSLADFVVENGYANAGCPDAGSEFPRGFNPIVTNPFFNVLNLDVIRKIPFSKKDIKKFDYNSVKDEMIENFPKNFLTHPYNFDLYDAEPYYKFFLYLAYHCKTLYLFGKKHQDGFSTILYNHKNEIICYHSWMSRFYKKPYLAKIKKVKNQTARIDALRDEAYAMRNISVNNYNYRDKFYFLFDTIIRTCVKIPMRIARWPRKLYKKFN
jgi:hypothetical protein